MVGGFDSSGGAGEKALAQPDVAGAGGGTSTGAPKENGLGVSRAPDIWGGWGIPKDTGEGVPALGGADGLPPPPKKGSGRVSSPEGGRWMGLKGEGPAAAFSTAAFASDPNPKGEGWKSAVGSSSD